MLGTWFFSCCLKKMMNTKCVFKLYQQILLLVREKLPWEHILRRNVSNVFWKAFWSWQCTFLLDLLFGWHSDQALITLASITYCTLRSHVKCITISITRHFDHYLIIVRPVRDLRFPFNFLVQIGLDCSDWYYDRCINLEKYLLSFHNRSF